ncbi:MAG TPA: antitoxin VapB family protein [Gammaproteobacteria bacterium]|nr:antitoxin VapB family protein [Gammaproteobacteria bacterium]
MKTITLTDEAYERLARLKTSSRDSFSKVVLRAVPKRGTGAQMLRDVRALPPLTREAADAMERAVADQRDPDNWRDPWESP